MLRIELLPARQGDAVLIEYGDPNRRSRVLIDAGTPKTAEVVRARLPEPGTRLELLVVTHIDRDHIGGVLQLLEDETRTLEIDDVWFNGYRHLPGALRPMGPVDGERLTRRILEEPLAWNGAFDGGAIVAGPDGPLPTQTLAGGLRLTVLSPRPRELARLRPIWEPVVQAAGLDPKVEPPPPQPVPAGLRAMGAQSVEDLARKRSDTDTRVPNGSSIALLAEFEEHRVLLCADAHPGVIREAIDRLLGDPDAKLSVDAFKLPHHGSRGNVDRALLDRVKAPVHLVSTDGTGTMHPHEEAIARTIVSQASPPILLFNYRSDFTERWDPEHSRAWRSAQRTWEARYAPDDASGIAVEWP